MRRAFLILILLTMAPAQAQDAHDHDHGHDKNPRHQTHRKLHPRSRGFFGWLKEALLEELPAKPAQPPQERVPLAPPPPAAAEAPASAPAAVDVLTQHGDARRSGVNLRETALTPE